MGTTLWIVFKKKKLPFSNKEVSLISQRWKGGKPSFIIKGTINNCGCVNKATILIKKKTDWSNKYFKPLFPIKSENLHDINSSKIIK